MPLTGLAVRHPAVPLAGRHQLVQHLARGRPVVHDLGGAGKDRSNSEGLGTCMDDQSKREGWDTKGMRPSRSSADFLQQHDANSPMSITTLTGRGRFNEKVFTNPSAHLLLHR